MEKLTAIENLVKNRVKEWKNKSDAQIRLQLGETTAQEIRSIRAVLNALDPEGKTNHSDLLNPQNKSGRPTTNEHPISN
jgi:hypothetical protein